MPLTCFLWPFGRSCIDGAAAESAAAISAHTTAGYWVYCAGIAGGLVGVSGGGGAVRATVGKGTGRSTDVDSDLNPAAGFTELPFATRNAPAVPEVALVCSALPRSAHGASACTGTGLTPGHICTGTGLTAATSAPGLGSPLPHLLRDSAHHRHICAGTGTVSALPWHRQQPNTRYTYTEHAFTVRIYTHAR